jgi:hypothetical protein
MKHLNIFRTILFLFFVTTITNLTGQINPEDTCNNDFDKYIVFNGPEKLPTFPGGIEALMIYIKENLNYPKLAIDSAYEDKVFITFCVQKTGKLTDLKVVKGKYEILNREALRIVSEMPNWEPAENRGEKLSYVYMLPINFILEKSTKRELRKIKRKEKKGK